MAIRYHIALPGSFDSHLSRPDFMNVSTLTIILRVFMREINPRQGRPTGTIQDSDRIPIAIDRWPAGEFVQWEADFEEEVERLWNGKLWIVPPDPHGVHALPQAIYRALLGNDRYNQNVPPSIRCAFDLQPVRRLDSSHAVISVVHLAHGAPDFRSYRLSTPGRDYLMLDDTDNAQEIDADRQPRISHTGGHEVAHLLGLKHINADDPACLTGAERICYGRTPAQRANIRGAGIQVNEADAEPWLERIARHTGHRGGWRATVPFTLPGA